MLRIYFTGDDLARTRIAAHPDPMWEILLSVYCLRRSSAEIEFGRWRRDTRRTLHPRMRPLLDLVPAAGSAPDFLTPASQGPDLEDGTEALLSTPGTRFRTDLASIARERTLPSWTTDLGQGRTHALQALTEAQRHYFHHCLAPHWPQVQAHIDQDVVQRSRTMVHTGVEALLGTLATGLRWHSPVLEVDYPFDHEIHLAGRGLLLQPVFFDYGPGATTLIDGSLSPVLAYPTTHQLGWVITGSTDPASGDTLTALLGSTRARVLRTVVAGDCTTTELARRAVTPLSTASRHASILRDAGLIGSRRHHNSTVHTGTSLGASLCRRCQAL